jgi:hypothetical protein
MIIPLGREPTAQPRHARCGHTRHVGTCPACQRAARRRSEAQLAAAVAERETWGVRGSQPRVCQRARIGI